jgi:hypothetical protein
MCLGDAGLDWSMPRSDDRDVVFLAELLRGGGDVVVGPCRES